MPADAPYPSAEKMIGFFNLPLAADTKIFGGTLVAVNASGEALPAADTTGLKVLGRAEATVDNTGGSAGDKRISVKRGIFRVENSASNAVTAAHVGLQVDIEDDTIVSLAGAGNGVAAGICISVDGDHVIVDTMLAPAL